MARVYAVVAAAGQSTRMGGIDKQLLRLGGVPVLRRTLSTLDNAPQVDGILLVTSPDRVSYYHKEITDWNIKKLKAVIPGGENRQQSVLLGLLAVPLECQTVLIHDGARPLVTPCEIENLIIAAHSFGAATLAVPVKDTVKEMDSEGFVVRTLERAKLWLTQTPQGFSRELLWQSHKVAQEKGLLYTDDASLVEACGHQVKVVPGSYSNIKITTVEDIPLAEALLNLQGEG